MARFSIMRYSHERCGVDLASGAFSIAPAEPQASGLLVVDESERIALRIQEPDNTLVYRVIVGDELPQNPEGRNIAGMVFWEEDALLESASGNTQILLQGRSAHNEAEPWLTQPRGRLCVWVQPSKMSARSYDNMSEQLAGLSRSLLSDLYGKSRRRSSTIRASQSITGRDHELRLLNQVVKRMEALLPEINRRPSSRIGWARRMTNYWGDRPISLVAMRQLARQSLSLETSTRPLRVLDVVRSEKLDIPEHSIIAGFLLRIIQRCEVCRIAARDQQDRIEKDKPWRHLRLSHHSPDRPTLYESEDQPKLKRLGDAQRLAADLYQRILRLTRLSVFENVEARWETPQGGTFSRSAAYRDVWQTMTEFSLRPVEWQNESEGNDEWITKKTSRLFEQWCFLSLVDAFRCAGLDLTNWAEILRNDLATKFIIDFERGLTFQGYLGERLRVLIRYEPWIFPKDEARRRSESLSRPGRMVAPWSPDVLIECQRFENNEWRPIYVIVLDAKYKRILSDRDWSQAHNYQSIQATDSGIRVTRQVWLMRPGDQGIRLDDEPLDFVNEGPEFAPGDPCITLTLGVTPGDERCATTFKDIALGLLNFFRRHFV